MKYYTLCNKSNVARRVFALNEKRAIEIATMHIKGHYRFATKPENVRVKAVCNCPSDYSEGVAYKQLGIDSCWFATMIVNDEYVQIRQPSEWDDFR